MKVLVWQGYGCTSVYRADSQESFEKLVAQVDEIVSGTYPEESLEEFDEIKTLWELSGWVNENCRGDDSFDKFEICELQ